jgi:hypothetical protein
MSQTDCGGNRVRAKPLELSSDQPPNDRQFRTVSDKFLVSFQTSDPTVFPFVLGEYFHQRLKIFVTAKLQKFQSWVVAVSEWNHAG